MGLGGKGILRAVRVYALLISAFVVLPSMVFSADYPRRIAIAPFTSLAKEDIQQTVSVLPRLLSSRLMALAGAEVLLLPAGEKSAEDAAKGAGLPLLLKGSVAKLGTGYSIDVTVAEVATGKMAGAFFASAATEDEIIARLGELATEISEKMFGVKAVARAHAPPPAAQLPASYPAVPPPVAPVGGPSPIPTPGPVSTPVPASPGTAALQDSGKEWVPTSLKKIAESGMITDELHGIVSGDVDSVGNAEVIAYGKKGIYLYRVSGTEILSKSRISGGLPGQILNVEAVDLDLDGVKEIVVTGIDGDNLRSSVWKKKGEAYERIADRIPYFLVFLPDWQGRKVVAGQQAGSDTPFQGKLYEMSWNGKKLAAGKALPADTLRAPLSSGILGLSSSKFGEEWKWIYTDETNHLRVLDAAGNTAYKTGAKYGWSGDSFEWGLYLPRVGKTRYYARKAPRVSRGPGGNLLVLAPRAEEGLMSLESSSKTTRLVLLRWDGGEFVEVTGTPKGDRIYSGADFLSPTVLRREGKVVASAIEKPDGVLKGGISRVLLFQVE
jgi:hypothetical protein